jgi:hypothetical protein
MASTVDLWTPPAGMRSEAVKAWRAFYSKAMDLYALSPADYRLLYVAQRGRCWICRTAKGIHPDDPKAAGTRRLGIDHDHITGAVRGLLCTGGDKTCNRVIGWLSAPALLRAAQYLDRPSTRPARVLAEIRSQEFDAELAGSTLTQAEADKLADAFLWRGHAG